MGLKLKTLEDEAKFRKAFEDNLGYELQEIKLHLTKRCNLKCIMCGGGKESLSEPKLEEIVNLIDQGKNLGLITLKLFGGEPTLRKDLIGIINYASGRKVDTFITTNGTLIDQERARDLVGAGLSKVTFSIDSPYPNKHDKIRGVTGTFDKVERALYCINTERVKQGRSTLIQVNSVIMRDNYKDLPRLVSFCGERGVNELTLNPATSNHPLDALDHDSEEYLLFKDMFLTLENIEEYNQEVIPKVLELTEKYRIEFSSDNAYLFGREKEEMECASRGLFVDSLLKDTCCLKAWYYAIVNSNFELVACNRVKDPIFYPIGSLREHSLVELWNSPKYMEFREMSKNPSFIECRLCCFPYMLSINKKTKNLGLKERDL